jgi:uncharacterized RDD family membrane protein YckC
MAQEKINFYCIRENGREGPYTINQLKELNISKDTYVWYSNLAEWTEAKNVEALKDIFASPMAPSDNRKNLSYKDISEREIESQNDIKYAGFWMRFLAFIIDAIILLLINTIITVIFHLTPVDIITKVGPLVIFRQPIFLITGWLYYAFMESSKKQATLGKWALDLKVTDYDTNPISFGKATGRFFSKFLSIIIIYIGFLMIAFTKKKQGLHDKLAGALVIKDIER